MASINEVTIDLKFTGLNNLEQATKKMRQVQTEVKRLAKEEKAGALSADQYSKRVSQLATELQKATKGNIAARNAVNTYSRTVRNSIAATDAAKKAAEELAAVRKRNATILALQEQRLREEARAQAESTAKRQREIQSYNQLRAVIDQSYAARMRLRQAAQTLRAAEEQGLITREQAIEQLRQYRTAAQQSTQMTQLATRRQSALGVVFQQTGYQVGDFAVQVQSGTHYMVALGQQLTQLVGVGAMMAKSTAWIAAFSGLGIIVPIATAIVGAFMRSKDAAEETQKEINKLSDTISKLNSVQKTTAIDFESGLTKAFGDSASAVGRLLTRLREAEFAAAMEPVKNVIDDITVEIDRVDVALDSIVAFDKMINSGQQLSEVQQSILEDAKKLVSENLSLAIAYDDVRAAIDSIADSQTTGDLITNFSEALALAESIGGPAADAIVQGLIDAAREAGLYEEIMQRADDETDNVSDGVSRITERANEAARAAFGIFQALRSASMAMAATEAGITAGQRAAARGASEFETKATQAAATEEARLTGLGVTGPELSGAVAQAYQNEMRRQQAQAAERALYAGFDTDGGGAGVDPVEEYNRAKAAVDQLRASYDEQYVTSLKIAEAEEKINKAMELGVYTKGQGKEALDDYIASLEDADDTMSQFVNDTASQMSDAFMSIVDGSKSASDAFGDMARAILKQAFELAVINPIINSIFGGVSGFNPLPSLLGSANGNAFSDGRVVPFANGGVVSSPTMFPMRGAQAGLMGEAGPEAIMPLKRGKGGKLGVVAEGASQPVVIHQNFNFSANGDDSVKRIIAQEAPKIASLTQKQILDQRARGGAFKTTFG